MDLLALAELPARVLAHARRVRGSPSRLASALDGGDTEGSDRDRGERFQAEVPALQKLKLVFGLELKGQRDIQLYRVELPGPKITKDLAQDERVLVEIDRPQFNELAESGTLKSYRKAYETGHIKATGDSNVLKLIAQVVERQEQRSRLKKVQ